MVTTVTATGSLAVPREAMDALGLEPGDSLRMRIDEGQLVLTPLVSSGGVLRLTPKGEAKEAEADEDIRAGRVRQFNTLREFLEDLDDPQQD